jgi:uncharacterized protein YbbC (DUF1343 family)
VVMTGIDRIAAGYRDPVLSGRAALLTNQSGVSSTFRSSVDIIRGLPGLELAFLFSPEHGLYGEAQDQVPTEENRDPVSGLPVVSLYGNLREPEPRHFENINLVLVDIQDVGSRYYTFSFTMALVMKAAKEAGVAVAVLDRPNPIGGLIVEGNVVEERFFTFVGLFPLAVRHGMTIAELALLYNDHHDIGATVVAVPMEGWSRDMFWGDTGLPWIPPSPNIPIPETAMVYPGMCLLEGTNVSEGRGTTRPFEVFGAPFIHPEELRQKLCEHELPGVAFRPVYFEPTFGKWVDRRCGGIWLHITDPNTFKPFLTGIAVIKEVYSLCGDDFSWREPPYEFEENILPIDMLFGTDRVRKAIEAGEDLKNIEALWKAELSDFQTVRASCLLY